MTDRRVVVVDGSNLATEGRTTPSLQQLDEAVRAYAEEDPEAEIVVVVDASFEHRVDASERAALEEAELHGEVVSPPAGAIGRGDAFVLRIAERTGASVLSNDSFQEFHAEHPWLFDEGRLIGGKPVPGIGWIFTPRIPVRGPKSRQATARARRAGGGGAAELSAPDKAAELAKAARKAAAARMAVLPDGTKPKVGDVWRTAPPAGVGAGAAAAAAVAAEAVGGEAAVGEGVGGGAGGGEAEPVPAAAPARRRRGAKAAAKALETAPATTGEAAEVAAVAEEAGAEPAGKKAPAKRGAKKAPAKEAAGRPAGKKAAAGRPAGKKAAAKKAAAEEVPAEAVPAEAVPAEAVPAGVAGAPAAKVAKASRARAGKRAGAAKKAMPEAAVAPTPELVSAEGTAAEAEAEAAGAEAEAEAAGAEAAPAAAAKKRSRRAKKAAPAEPAQAAEGPAEAAQAVEGPATEVPAAAEPAPAAAAGRRGRAAASRSRPREDPALREAIDEATAEALSPPVEEPAEVTAAGALVAAGGVEAEPRDGKGGRRRRRRAAVVPPPAVNEPLAFITFVATFPVGSELEGEVVSFTSHGAMVDVPLPGGEALHCYIPLTAMGEPPPTKARQVLSRGERRPFVLTGLDPSRRVAELALPGVELATSTAAATTEA